MAQYDSPALRYAADDIVESEVKKTHFLLFINDYETVTIVSGID
jgi:hypothetical protein